jgi:hypothetical protein
MPPASHNASPASSAASAGRALPGAFDPVHRRHMAAGGYGRKVATGRGEGRSGCVTPIVTPEAGFRAGEMSEVIIPRGFLQLLRALPDLPASRSQKSSWSST